MTINSKFMQSGVVISKKFIHTDERPPVTHHVLFGATRDGMSDKRQYIQEGVDISNKDIHADESTPVSHWVAFGATRDGMSGSRPQLAKDGPQSVTERQFDD